VPETVQDRRHLIVAHQVTNVGHDRDQLANMGAHQGGDGVESLDVLADRGYFCGEEVLACDTLGVTPYVPRPLTSGAKADGRLGKQDFVYIPDRDVYPRRALRQWALSQQTRLRRSRRDGAG
jgi:hypothetical protein